ncbi:SMI1/KNR4 family protein [Actinoplanes subglobosus]|uniref:SMI1/KNR4 family protein n=1 Tax=Actinoplanes subglobosus TaxID=1547892 RepID=A0ABV8JAH2_9ACTN
MTDAPAAPLTEAEVAEVEEQFGVRLPGVYREFLIRVDAGGHGPRLSRLQRGLGGWEWADLPVPRGDDLGALAKPFPDQDAIQARLDELDEPAEYRSPEWLAWDELCEQALADQMNGTIAIGGDTTFPLLLVVTGPQRGTIWCDLRVTTEALFLVRNRDGSAATFADLYADWLTEAERLLDEGRTELRRWDVRTPMIENIFRPPR